MNRNEIKECFKWNLFDIYASDEEWEKDYKDFDTTCNSIIEFKGKLFNKEKLYELLIKAEEYDIKLTKLNAYAHMKKDENAANNKYVAFHARIIQLFSKWSTLLSFVNPELLKLSNEFFDEVINDKKFEDYKIALLNLKRNKPHVLQEECEEILAKIIPIMHGYNEVFNMIDNLDIPFPKVKFRGENIKLSHGLYAVMLTDNDVNTRKAAFNAMFNAYKSLINTISVNYISHVKCDCITTKVRKYDSVLEHALFNEDIPQDVYNKLIDSVNNSLDLLHNYVEKRKKLLGLKEMHMYDMHVALFKDTELKLEFDEAYNLVIDALKVHGEDYVNVLKKAKNERWIDVYENEGKRSGAYCSDCYGVHPYVLLNYQKTTHDVFTIAHELGHAMHSYYSDKNQPYAKADYSIFVAEVASTTNEILLLKYLINNSKDEKTRKYFLSYYLNMFRTTFFRQTMFSEFEAEVHKKVENDQAVTVDILNELYYKLNEKYYGKAVIHDDLIKYEWARIPHFYSSFYVYKYATGITTAIIMAKKILEGDKENFKKFITSGGSIMPYELLCNCGIDLAKENTYKIALSEFEDALNKL